MRGLLLLLLLAPATALAQVTTLVDHGPAEHRIDVVFLSEGYQAHEAERFADDVAVLLEGLRAADPFGPYFDMFNVHSVFVPSETSGIGPVGDGRGTVFRTRFRRENTTLVLANKDRVRQVAERAPGCDSMVVVCNEDRDVGARLGDAVFVSRVDAVLTLVHELGHGIGDLADEYSLDDRWSAEDAQERLAEAPRPNVSASADPLLAPWAHWIEPGSEVGLYAGGYYVRDGIYRPRRSTCRMRRYRNETFCEPCQEALVLAFYRAIPGHSALRVDRVGDQVVITLQTPVPAKTRRVAWSQSGTHPEIERRVARASEENAVVLTIPVDVLGRVVIEASVEDTTPWVRKGREALWSSTRVAFPRGPSAVWQALARDDAGPHDQGQGLVSALQAGH